MKQLEQFQAFLYANIPLVGHMQVQLVNIDDHHLTATAPLAPNINDKATVFGGSSAALMTICGWSLIKSNLEAKHIENDVVIHKSKLKWLQAQNDDMRIKATVSKDFNWADVAETLQPQNRSIKISVQCQVLNQTNEVCSQMHASYVILKK